MAEPTPNHDGLTAAELEEHASEHPVAEKPQPTDWNLWFLGLATGGSLSLVIGGMCSNSPALFYLGGIFTLLTILVYKFRRNH